MMKTKRFLAIILCMAMTLCMLPATVMAANGDVNVGNWRLAAALPGVYLKNNGDHGTAADYNIYYNSTTKTLYLKDFVLTDFDGPCIDVDFNPNSTDILTIVLEGDSILSTRSSAAFPAIRLSGNTVISGTGSLVATGGIMNTGTDRGSDSFGISAFGDLTIEGNCSVRGVGRDITTGGYQSTGVKVSNASINVNGGTLTGEGGKVVGGTLSVGVYAENKGSIIVSSDGTLVATGDEASRSYGVYADRGCITVSGGTLTGTGGEASSDSIGVYTDSGNNGQNIGHILVSGGTLNGRGGTASSKSYGVCTAALTQSSSSVAGDITVSGGVLNGTGGTASSESIGVCTVTGNAYLPVAGNINVSGGTTTAKGNTKALNKAPVINSSLTATASTDVTGANPVTYVSSNWNTYKYFCAALATYTISGTVTGSGAGLAGATVQLKQGTANVGGPITAGIGGAYTIPNVPAGTGYTIEVSKTGYNTGTIASFAVSANVANKNITLTETVTPPTPYTITYNANGGTGSMSNETAAAGTSHTMPACTFTAPTNKIFKEWAIGSPRGTRVAALGTHTFTANTTVYAVWEDAGNVGGTVSDNGSAVAGTVRVAVYRGQDMLADTQVDMTTGVYAFSNLPYGIYSLVATKTSSTDPQIITKITKAITIDRPTVSNQNMTLPEYQSNTLLETGAGTPPTAVEGLNDQFSSDNLVNDADTTKGITQGDMAVLVAGGKVDLTLSSQMVAEGNVPQGDADKVETKLGGNGEVKLFLDLTVTKTVTPNGGDARPAVTLTELQQLIDIVVELPAELRGKTLRVFRVHDGEAQELPQNSGPEYFEIDGVYLILHVKQFSTYALAESTGTQRASSSSSSFTMAGASYTGSAYTGAWGNGSLAVQADCSKLTSVTVDGVQLTKDKDYTVACDGTVITFTPAYLASLANGAHTVRVQFTDGQYTGTFTTPLGTAVTAVADVPATGGALFAWAYLLLTLALGLALRVKRGIRA